MPIDENRRCAVLGKPIGHSLSPVLHQAAYRVLDLRGWRYDRIEMDEDGLPAFLSALNDGWAGLSLTMPLKRTVMTLGTPCDRWSSELRVANTVVLGGDDGPLLFNTDVDGIRLALSHAREHSRGSVQPVGDRLDVVILGNGNTALSALAAVSMMARDLHVVVAARHPESRTTLRDFARQRSDRMTLETTVLDGSLRCIAEADIVISTLPAHAADPLARRVAPETTGNVTAQDGTAPLTPKRGAMLLDVAYDPHPSLLGHRWSQAGGLSIGGEEMLLYQAIGQVHRMTATSRGGDPRTVSWPREGFSPTDGHEVDVVLENAMRTALWEAM